MQEIAQTKGGKCLSENYLGPHKKLVWECAKGHRWETTPNTIKYGKSWCPKCWGKYASIADMKAIAEARGGKCLSEHYVNSQTKLKWACLAGHAWEAEPASVKQGRWCPECGGSKKKTLEEIRQLAAQHSGKFVSSLYLNSGTKVRYSRPQTG